MNTLLLPKKKRAVRAAVCQVGAASSAALRRGARLCWTTAHHTAHVPMLSWTWGRQVPGDCCWMLGSAVGCSHVRAGSVTGPCPSIQTWSSQLQTEFELKPEV